MLEIDFLHRRGDFELVVRESLDSPVTGVFGHSGAGKSTLLHLVAGLLVPNRGALRLDADTLVDVASGSYVPSYRRRIGVVFQDARLFPHYSVRGNLRYGEKRSGGTGKSTFDEVVALLELETLLERSVRTLSGGEAQRVALGRALLASPRLLLFDEPLAGLDAGLKRQILLYLKRVRDRLKIRMLYVSHDLREILQLTDHVIVLDHGQVVGRGTLGDLAANQQVLDGGFELSNVLELSVSSHERNGGLTNLGWGTEATLRAPWCDVPEGAGVTVSLRPEDIAVAVAPVEGISIRNQIPGTIDAITRHAGQAYLRIDVGVGLVAQVTQATVTSLGLVAGKPVWCLIKSNTIKYL